MRRYLGWSDCDLVLVLTCVQQDAGQVSQQHVLVWMSGRAAQLYSLLDENQGIIVVTLQIQDGGQVAHQHQSLTGDMRVSQSSLFSQSCSCCLYLRVAFSLLLAADVQGLLVVLPGLSQVQR